MLFWLFCWYKWLGRQIAWNIADESNVDNFEVQRSTDTSSGNFVSITTISAKSNAQTNSYSYLDSGSISTDIFYYRLKMVDKDGATSYSIRWL